MTNTTDTLTPVQLARRGQRGMRLWASVIALALSATTLVTITLTAGTLSENDQVTRQREMISRQADAIRQLCVIAASTVDHDTATAETCRRVARGESAVPAAAVVRIGSGE